ncbi:hypothetical protein DC20_18090 [Rufibacter tibetensis]|uniref:histidine kinase n=1 Tax=Rufibacter tibetensis TaxID=512763 RepID=A0A0P0D3Q6_9BACT|nr:hypothetical protein DC20_18090 [Rufibacter tibetensis]
MLTQQLWVTLFLFVIFLSPALGISIYLAREFALDSQLLKVKLIQVERLSSQNLAQQKEKQQILAHQNDELERQVAERTAQLHQSLQELKATQAQLIQSEKMASLGELSAGIAHEIQNPLNFVNNFSEVNVELLEEMEAVLQKGDTEDALALASDMKVNLRKINEHGKRADSIVKGMLLHSQTTSRQKEKIYINTLIEEYLRLSYQSFKTKDKTFQIDLTTQFYPDLPEIDTIPQYLGKVLLNLFNNAFYSVSEKKKTLKESYSPAVWVNTFKTQNGIQIRVKDNGVGIPQRVLDKIYQPFFTTKPSGQGTGLGLSLSYDIIKKGLGGELNVTSEEGEFAEFTIELPLMKVRQVEPVLVPTHE